MSEELRDRIARALWERECARVGTKRPEAIPTPSPSVFYEDADAVIAALGLVESRELGAFRVPLRRYVTLWERIEEGR